MRTMETFKAEMPSGQLTYLALGDSYTIGEAVAQEESFPFQLVLAMSNLGLQLAMPKIIARTGWTTGELQSAIKSVAPDVKYDIVTLLIGVNDQYRGNSPATYQTEFRELLQIAISFACGHTGHVFVISIPDWGITPFGKQSGRLPEEIAKEIAIFNAINKEETLNLGASYTDITLPTRAIMHDETLVAVDGLHPSGEMYRNWAIYTAAAIGKTFHK